MTAETPQGELGAAGVCPGAEQLAEYVESALGEAERRLVAEHLATCADCRMIVTESAISIADGHEVPRRAPWAPVRFRTGPLISAALAAAAALVVAVRADIIHWPSWMFGRHDDLTALATVLVEQPTRFVEGRLSLQSKYAPARSPLRGDQTSVPPAVEAAAARIILESAGQADISSIETLGIAYLAIGDLDSAVTTLEREPSGGRDERSVLLVDLSAALLAKGRRDNNADDLEAALSAVERALIRSGSLPEAVFNRALVLEQLHRPEASDVWKRYLDLDAQTPWADEARRHIAALSSRP